MTLVNLQIKAGIMKYDPVTKNVKSDSRMGLLKFKIVCLKERAIY